MFLVLVLCLVLGCGLSPRSASASSSWNTTDGERLRARLEPLVSEKALKWNVSVSVGFRNCVGAG